jgi:hypothetical protein
MSLNDSRRGRLLKSLYIFTSMGNVDLNESDNGDLQRQQESLYRMLTKAGLTSSITNILWLFPSSYPSLSHVKQLDFSQLSKKTALALKLTSPRTSSIPLWIYNPLCVQVTSWI